MDTVLYKTLLYDFYNELLTSRQRQIYELYYQDDMSLSEIAEQVEVTPQGVSDIIKRTEKALLRYEAKLKLIESFIIRNEELENIYKMVDNIEAGDNQAAADIRAAIRKIMDNQ